MGDYKYQVGGSLTVSAPNYVKRPADSQLYKALKHGEFCYVLNSRQMGKSSLLASTKSRLEREGFKCSTIDMSMIGTSHITPLQWYKSVLGNLCLNFNLLNKIDLKVWWREQENLSLLEKLRCFIEELLHIYFPQQELIIFIDEIDSILSLDFSVDDFFAFIQFCYNQRSINPEYKRITFAIFGVATLSDLIRNKKCTQLNIGKSIALEGFKLHEAIALTKGFAGKVGNPDVLLKEILVWTDGQPFLTQKLCYLISNYSQDLDSKVLFISLGKEAFWVESVVKSSLLHNWESKDEPEHLRTIQSRIFHQKQYTGRILGVYEQILQGVEVSADNSREQVELLLSGLVVKQQGVLKVKNRIYQEVFNLEWVKKQLDALPPYFQAFDTWITSKPIDESCLLGGQAIEAQIWLRGNSLSDLNYRFLANSKKLNRKEVQPALEVERAKEALHICGMI
ncbi:hypothetical protein BZZ01_08090 [Nostocales cyanobacterium HT-58-2]|nr:hypothetical protein BZZ01_08090 [Nostocales cyanobacterium HT-58-2]